MPYKSAFRKSMWMKTNKARLRKKSIDYLGGQCTTCKQTEPDVKLEFDHIDPLEKDFQIPRNFTIEWKRLVVELKKCQLLCYDCHKIKTYGDPLF